MIFFLKNQMPKYLVVLIITVLIMIGCVYIDSFSYVESLDIILGNTFLGPLMFKVIFIISTMLLLFLQTTVYMYYLRNSAYFYARSIKKHHIINGILLRTCINIIVYLLIILVVYLSTFNMAGIYASHINILLMGVSLMKGFGKYFILSVIHLILLMVISEDKGFVILLVGIVFYTYLNFIRLNLREFGMEWYFIGVGVFYMLLALIMIIVAHKLFVRMEK